MTERQARKELLRRAVDISPTVHVGKDGIDDKLIAETSNQLKKKHLIKVKVLPSVEGGAEATSKTLSEATGGVVVDVRGGVIVLCDARTWNNLSKKV